MTLNQVRAMALAGLCASFGVSGSPAWALDSSPAKTDPSRGCACVGPLSGEVAGSVSALSGDVSTLGAGGFSPAVVDAPLRVGTRVVTGPNSSATLSLTGGCKLRIQANSDADISTVNRKYCVRVSRAATAPAEGSPQGGTVEGSGAGGSGGAGEAGLGEAGAGGLSGGVVAGGAIVLGAVGAVISISSSQRARPFSP